MKKKIKKFIFFMLFVFIFNSGCEPKKYYIRPNTEIKKFKKIAVLPFENFTSDEYAGEKLRNIVISELLLKGIEVIEPGEVTKVLEEAKIYSLSSIKITDLQEIGKKLGVEGLIMGAVECFSINRGISITYPEVTINLRLIDVSSGNIIWSIRHTKGGANFWTRHFGTEGITLSECAKKAVKEAIDTLF